MTVRSLFAFKAVFSLSLSFSRFSSVLGLVLPSLSTRPEIGFFPEPERARLLRDDEDGAELSPPRRFGLPGIDRLLAVEEDEREALPGGVGPSETVLKEREGTPLEESPSAPRMLLGEKDVGGVDDEEDPEPEG